MALWSFGFLRTGRGRFSTELFERYQRSEKALVGTLAEMYVQGVSTRKVKAVTEALCGHSFSASSISAINKSLDESLKAFSERRLSDAYPYLILDARYERIREGGVITNQAVLVAVAVDWEGRRQILAVELANRESRSSWRNFLLGLRDRGLTGVEFVVSDDHAGLKAAIRKVLPEAVWLRPEAVWQRCYVHFLRNALDYVPRKVDDDCLRDPLFAIDHSIAQRWWVNPFLRLVRSMPLDPTRPLAVRTLVKAVRDQGETLVIFPEGRLAVTRQFDEGLSMMALA